MRLIPILILPVLVVLLVWASFGQGDQVILKNGGILHARSLERSGVGSIAVEMEDGTVSLSQDQVQQVIVEPKGWTGYLIPPSLSASSALLVERETGRIILEKNSRERRPMASLTKLMTAVLVLERGDLGDWVTVSRRAAGTRGSALGLRPGQRVLLKNLLLGLLVRSANDAAVAAAEHVCGSEEEFVKRMNQKAGSLGLADTHFANCHGLDHPDHYSTAFDMARLGRHAISLPFIANCVRNREVVIQLPGSHRPRVCRNSNKLLRFYWGADGIKTGYTEEAGKCLVGSASRGGHQLIAVLLNDNERWQDACGLFEYGFHALSSEKRNLAHQGRRDLDDRGLDG
jgi:serine-type D-Ala-D-Ala carboxypeptidase (penicillin-binding protein 5/6)